MSLLIGIIVPVYNVASYLDRCLQSVCGQTYEHIEIIIVDDGSTDESPTVCDAWAEQDRRIRVIHKENGKQVWKFWFMQHWSMKDWGHNDANQLYFHGYE